VFVGKEQPKRVGKCQKLKEIQVRSDNDYYSKQIFGKMLKF